MPSRSRLRMMLQPQQVTHQCMIHIGTGEVVERLVGHLDRVLSDEPGTFGGTDGSVLERTLPFEHGPAGIIVAGQAREYSAEIDLTVSEGAEARGARQPGLISAIY